jgi:hypothetical protein
MHPFLQAQLAALHQADLQADADATRGPRRSSKGERTRGSRQAEVVIRRSTSGDGPALAALSALDGAPMPFGPALVAEVAGVPSAVLPLDGGRPFGDPFARTDELIALLELRAAQLRDDDEPAHERHGVLGWMSPAAAIRRFV